MQMGTTFKTVLLSGMAALSSLACLGQKSDFDRKVDQYRTYGKERTTTRSAATRNDSYNDDIKPAPKGSNQVIFDSGIYAETNNIDHARWTTQRSKVTYIINGERPGLHVGAYGGFDWQWRLRTFESRAPGRYSAGVRANRYRVGTFVGAGFYYTTDPHKPLQLTSSLGVNVPTRRNAKRAMTLAGNVRLAFNMNAEKVAKQKGTTWHLFVEGSGKAGLDEPPASAGLGDRVPYLLTGVHAGIGLKF